MLLESVGGIECIAISLFVVWRSQSINAADGWWALTYLIFKFAVYLCKLPMTHECFLLFLGHQAIFAALYSERIIKERKRGDMISSNKANSVFRFSGLSSVIWVNFYNSVIWTGQRSFLSIIKSSLYWQRPFRALSYILPMGGVTMWSDGLRGHWTWLL